MGLWVGLALLILVASLSPFSGGRLVSASPDRLKWSVVDTPSGEGNVVVSPSEINAFVSSSDEIFYAIDIPQGKIYKSTDQGLTWNEVTTITLQRE